MSAVPKIPDLTRVTARLDALTDWERRPRSKMRVGLEPMRDLGERLGEPQKSFRSIHVAGTKGKGSVSALIEAALVRAGLRVGRYGSPHVERLTERVSLDGREIDEPNSRPRPRSRARRVRGGPQGRHAGGQCDLVRPSDRRRFSHFC